MIHVLKNNRIIPVITIDDPEDAVALAQALVLGGIRILEVTLRTPNALSCVQAIRHHVPQAYVGVGTVRSVSDLERAAHSGAQFAVSPGCTLSLANAAHHTGLPFMPGVATISEVMNAQDLGFSCLKLFPSELIGGAKLLRHMASLFPGVMFCPTGGISQEQVADYLKMPNVVSVGGSWLSPQHLIEKKDWEEITRLAQSVESL
jgi:2-dehydro-3-deoxyphosphogluconate aldolase/(4S)-4-hydroxy-2-oxoglutarate aldolase